MKKVKILQTLILTVLLNPVLSSQQAQNPQTFCNPLNLNYRFMSDVVDAREAADPVMILFKGDYYLFASHSGGYYTSSDLRDWTLIIPTGIDIETYAPGVLVMRDSLFYIPSNDNQIYKTGDPKSGVWTLGPAIESYGDPAFFLDDDERLYMFYGLSDNQPTGVVELDPATFEEISPRVQIALADTANRGWERSGDDNLYSLKRPYIEGSWMIKENGKYYLHYSAPGTEWKTYADGIYTADSPLGPYQYAPYSPFSFKPTGFIGGAGHGSTFKDKDGHYWRVVTMAISVKNIFERRLGLFPVDFDQDGQIRCNTSFGDYPQYYPGIISNPIDDNFAGMLLLSHKKYAAASSSLEGHSVELAFDEDIKTYWSALSGGTDEWLMVDLGKECNVEAIQVNFGEHNTIPEQVRGRNVVLYEQYIIEKSSDGSNWETLVDKSQNLTDVPHDYIELENPVSARYIRLANVFTPGGGNFAVRDLRVFGNSDQAVFTEVDDFTVDRNIADGRNALISWSPVTGADGYIIRYGIAPDKLYNNYMVYDADSVAIHSLNVGVNYYFEVDAFASGTEYYRSIGEFRSFQSGNWNDAAAWAMYDGTQWINPAPNAPAPQSDGSITILDGHTITVNADDSTDQLTIASGGKLLINKDVLFKVKDGLGIDLRANGTISNYGTLTSDPSAALSFENNGLYEHKQNGGSIPAATWKSSSICLIDSVKETIPLNLNQNFFNFVWNCQDQTGDLNLGWNGNTIGGNITITNTGSGKLYMCNPGAGTSAEVTIKGNVIQSDGEFSSNGTSNANTSITIDQKGSIAVSGGNFSISRGSQGGSGTTVWNLEGNLSLINAATQNSNPGGAGFLFTNDGIPQSLLFTDVTFGAGGFPVEVDSAAILDIGTSILEGNGSFTLKKGATLITAHEQGINGSIAATGLTTFDENSSFHFNGSAAQVTGSLLPDAVNDLVIDNSTSVTLSKSVIVNGRMKMKKGSFSAGSGTLSYGPNASLEYSGEAAQTTTDAEFPPNVKPGNLIIANTRGVTLHASRTAGFVEIFGKLKLGTNILTADSASEGDATIFIVTNDGGELRLANVGSSQKLFPIGTILYSPVWISNDGAADTVGVGAVREDTKAPYGGRVRVKWNIDEAAEGEGDYTLKLGWITSLEDNDFKSNRAGNARIYNLSTMTEAGTGDYTLELEAQPSTLSRGGITELGSFSVGAFGEATGVDDDENIPLRFGLEQNYPNPFNPSTTIKYSLAGNSKVSIIVYDILGRKIATLVDSYLEAGRYKVEWNANVASGLYIYRMIANDYVQIRKMMLLK